MAPPKPRGRLNLPLSDRLLESVWGILIVLSVTGSADYVTRAPPGEVFLIGFVTAFAWGVVEAVMDLLRRKMERTRSAGLMARAAAADDSAEEELADALRDSPMQHLVEEDQARIRALFLEGAKRSAPPQRRVLRKDVVASVETGVTLWAAALPVLIPFVLVGDGRSALAISQGTAIAILFGLGAAWGRYSGQSAVRTGTLMAAMGLGLAALLQFLNA